MKVVIIEDEVLLAESLRRTLLEIDPTIEIMATIGSIREALEYFETHPHPDLFFSDIELSDGQSFHIFKTIKSTRPVVFCTAYNEYALNAFEVNGIDYLLKPYTREHLEQTLQKYNRLKENTDTDIQTPAIEELIELLKPKSPATILLHKGEQITPVRTDKIALVIKEESGIKIYLESGERYPTSQTMDKIEHVLGTDFYRLNRQAIVRKDQVKHVNHYFARKLLIETHFPTDEKLIVSKAKASHFLKWLES